MNYYYFFVSETKYKFSFTRGREKERRTVLCGLVFSVQIKGEKIDGIEKS